MFEIRGESLNGGVLVLKILDELLYWRRPKWLCQTACRMDEKKTRYP